MERQVRIPADTYGTLFGCASACEWISIMANSREKINSSEIKEILQRFCPANYRQCWAVEVETDGIEV